MSGQRIGYVRVSSVDQHTDRQLAGIKLDETFEDKASAKDANRPALTAMLKHLRKGDILYVHSMDRLARNVDDLRKIVLGLAKKGVEVRFTKEGLVFTAEGNPLSEMMLSIIGAVAQFERDLIRERQREGIAAAKASGRYVGGQPKLNASQAASLRQRAALGIPIAKVAREFGVSRQSVYNYIAAETTPAAG